MRLLRLATIFNAIGLLSRQPLARLAQLFRLERSTRYEVAVPLVEEFRRSGDVATLAHACTDLFRAFTEPVLRASSAGQLQLVGPIEEGFGRAERQVRQDPERYELRYIAVAMPLPRTEAARGSSSPLRGGLSEVRPAVAVER